MSASNSRFLQELETLEKLIGYYILEIKLINIPNSYEFPPELESIQALKNLLKNFSVDKRTYNYNSLVISLYGYFEKFIEELIESYVNDMNTNIVEYEKLPEMLIKHHLPLSLQMITKVENVKYQGQLSKEKIICNLNSCINIKQGYTLNIEAFKQHSANFRYQIIDEIFSKVGIEKINIGVTENTEFRAYLIDRLGKNEEYSFSFDDAFYLIDDLAERRNDVAHGVVAQILNPEIFNDYILFFKIYSAAITKKINDSLAMFQFMQNADCLGELTGWFQGGEIVCFQTKNKCIKIGDEIWGINDNCFVRSKIISMQLDDTDIKKADEKKDLDIGVKLSHPLKKSHRIFILKSDSSDTA